MCVDLKRRLSATTSVDLNRILNLTRITRISFKEISRNLIWKAMASAVDKLVVKGNSTARKFTFICSIYATTML